MDWKGELFVVPVDDEVLFPHGVLNTVLSPEEAFDVEELIDQGPVLFVARRPGLARHKGHRGLYRTGTIAELAATESPDGTVHVVAMGLARASVERYRGREPSLYAQVTARAEAPVSGVDESRVLHELRAAIRRIGRVDRRVEQELVRELMPIGDTWQLVDLIAGNLVPELEDRQRLLETWNRYARLELVREHLRRIELTFSLPGDRPPDAYLN